MKHLAFAALILFSLTLTAEQPALVSTQAQVQQQPVLTLEQQEELLRSAKIIKAKWLGNGITNPRKLTLTDGKMEFHAIFKTIDEHRAGITSMTKGLEMDFKDSWRYDVAAYELNKMLGLDMVPATVERNYKGDKGAIQWWVENALVESDRYSKNIVPPDVETYNREIMKVRLFDNLVYNIDRNLGNLLYDPAWKVWMIDHSRCFKNMGNLKSPGDLKRFSTSMIEAIRKLDAPGIRAHCGKYLSQYEIESMLKRRDAILKLYTKMVAEKGDSILYP